MINFNGFLWIMTMSTSLYRDFYNIFRDKKSENMPSSLTSEP